MSPFLTDDEIAAATEPLTQGAARIKFFERLGVKVDAKPNGQPLVCRSEFDAARRREEQAANDGRQVSRDWSAFEKKVRYGRDGAKA